MQDDVIVIAVNILRIQNYIFTFFTLITRTVKTPTVKSVNLN